MKVMVVAETFLPLMNGVTNSVLHTLGHLRRRGDQVIVVAPSISLLEPNPLASDQSDQFELCQGFPVIRVPSVALPEYRTVRVSPGFVARLRNLMQRFGPDVVHIASPFILGWRAIQAANSLKLPTVSVYQTEVPHYAARYKIPWAAELLWQHVQRIHSASTVTLVPSTFCRDQLRSRGIQRVKIWGRGVDHRRFSPQRRCPQLRNHISPQGEKLIGFVGRLAAEKQIEDLAVVDSIPGTRLVIIGTGPAEASLRELLPRAYFAGYRSGDDLGAHMASLDVFVHPGEAETFCQTIQEAMAAGVPVVAVGRGGPLDLVDPGHTGWLYAPGDLGELERAVRELTSAQSPINDVAAHCVEAVRERSWEAVCNELVGHYARAIEATHRLHWRHRSRSAERNKRESASRSSAQQQFDLHVSPNTTAFTPDDILLKSRHLDSFRGRLGVSSVL